MGCVYKIIFPNGKSYIGVTSKSAEERFEQHIKDSHRDKNNRQVLSAIKKYGRKNCVIDTLIISDDTKYLKEMECRAIVSFNTKSPNGYNLTSGGDGVIDLDSESEKLRVEKMKKTMSASEYKNKQKKIQESLWNEEKKCERSESVRKLWKNKEYRNKTSKAHIGRIASKEENKKRSQSIKKFYENNPEKAELISQRSKEMWKNPEFRKKVSSAKEKTSHIIGRKTKERWADPQKRKEIQIAMHKSFTPERLKRTSEIQKRIMENTDLRNKIAVSLNKHKGKTFKKLRNINPTRKDGLVRKTWDLLGNIFTAEDAIKLGWWSRYFDRSMASGWIEIVN